MSRVLNVNDLAIAVKPAVIPGEQIFVQLVKNGKEEGRESPTLMTAR